MLIFVFISKKIQAKDKKKKNKNNNNVEVAQVEEPQGELGNLTDAVLAHRIDGVYSPQKIAEVSTLWKKVLDHLSKVKDVIKYVNKIKYNYTHM